MRVFRLTRYRTLRDLHRSYTFNNYYTTDTNFSPPPPGKVISTTKKQDKKKNNSNYYSSLNNHRQSRYSGYNAATTSPLKNWNIKEKGYNIDSVVIKREIMVKFIG